MWFLLLFVPTLAVKAQGWDWAKYANSPASDRASGAACDKKNGDLYVVGSSTGALSEYGLTNLGASDGYVAKYNAKGKLLWAFRVAGSGADEVTDIALDSVTHRFYITGYISGNVTIGGRGGAPFSSSAIGNQDMFVAAFDSAGNVLWGLREGAGNLQLGVGIALDNNYVYVTGNYDNHIDFDGTTGSPTISKNATGTLDWWVAKYRKSNGALIWAQANQSGINIQRANGIAVDSSGVYFCGGFSSALTRAAGPLTSVTVLRTGPVNMEAFFFRLRRSDGLAQWGVDIGSNAIDDEATGIAVRGNKLYLSGRGGGVLTFPPLASITVGASQNGFISRHDTTNGNALWANILGNASGAVLTSAADVRIDEGGAPWITGFFGNQLLLPNIGAPTTTLTSNGLNDLYLANYTTTGAINFSLRAGGAGNDGGSALAIRNRNNVYVVGAYSTASGLFNTFPPTNLPFEGSEDIQVALYSLCAQHPDTTKPISAVSNDICIGASASILLPNSEVGITYTLIDTLTGTAYGPSQVGNGGTLTFPTSALTSSITFGLNAYVSQISCTERLSHVQSITVHALPTVNLGPDIAQCGGFGPALNAGPGFSSYIWSTFQPSQSIVATSSGTYSVTVTDSYGCQGSDAIVVNLYPLPTPNLGPDVQSCVGSSVVLNPGSGYAGYAWSTGATTPTISVSTNGTYTVTVTDANGCTASDAIAVNFNALPTPNLGPDQGFCQGGSTVLNAGPGYASYLWSDGSTGQTLTVTTSNAYQVTVTDANGCQGSDQVIVTVHLPPNPNLGADTSYCDSGMLTLTPMGSYVGYAWNTGATTASIPLTASGNYQVTVVDGFGCSGSDDVNVILNPIPTPNLGPDTNICNGSSINLNAGGGYVNYAWIPGNVGQFMMVTTAGLVQVTVTDANGCSASDEIVIGLNPSPTPNLGPDTSICAGATVTLASTGTFASYLWSDGQTTPTITVGVGAAYALTVTDLNGCTGTDAVLVSTIANPAPALGPDMNYCMGSSHTLSTSTTYSSYLWNTGATTSSINVSTAGIYSVTVTNAGGCQGRDSINVNFQALPTPNLGPDRAICVGQSTVLSTPGIFNSYVWSSGSIAPSITVSAPGSYSVTVFDANGCQGSDQIIISSLPLPTPNLGPDRNLCQGSTVTLATSTGYPSYSWSNVASTPTITVATGGSYSVTVTDVNGCQGSDQVNVTLQQLPRPDLGPDVAVCGSPSQTLSLGQTYAGYTWSTSATTPTISVSTSGMYKVTVTDGNGCQGSDSVLVNFYALPTPNLGTDIDLCAGDSVALATNVSYTSYLWSNGDTLDSTWVSATGDYQVTVTDVNGCQASDEIHVELHALPLLDLGPDSAFCANIATTLGSTGSFVTYAWSTGATTPTIPAAASGTYNLTVTDAFGCQASDQVIVTVYPLPTPSLGADISACTGFTPTLSLGASYTSYLWSTGATATFITVNATGTYDVTVTDGNGCSASDTVLVTIQPLPTPNLGADLDLCAGNSATLATSQAYVSYAWSTSQTTATISVNTTGTYQVTVTDANNCQASDQINVTVHALPTPNLGPDVTVCAGNSVQLSTTGTYASYAWSTGATTSTINTSTAGTYDLTVTDAFSCTGSDQIVVNVNALPVASTLRDTTICPGDSTTLTAVAGMTSYLWSTGATTPSIVAAAGGNYMVTVVSNVGCMAYDTMTLSLHAAPLLTVGPDTATCSGINVTVNATPGFVTYAWNTNQSTPSILTAGPGWYAVIGTDANGCRAQDSMQLSFLALPVVQLGPDTSICQGDSLLLDGGLGMSGYAWNTGQSTQQLVVDSAGDYAITITDAAGCQGRDTMHLALLTLPSLNLGVDTAVCTGDSIQLGVPAFTASQYSWNTGQSNSQIWASWPGAYILQITDTLGCHNRDTVNLANWALPVVNLGPDTAVCPGVTVTLDAGNVGSNYDWSPSGASQTLAASTPGNYEVTVTDLNGCRHSDSLILSNFTLPTLALQDSVWGCIGSTFVLHAGIQASSFLWSDGSTADSLLVSSAGTFYIDAIDTNGCNETDTTVVSFRLPPVVSLGPDTMACLGSGPILLSVPNSGWQCLWSTGDTTHQISTLLGGNYAVTVTDGFGCQATDTVAVTRWIPTPVTLRNDTAICQGDSVLLTANGPFASLLWNGVTLADTVYASATGTWSVLATDLNGCTATDSMSLTVNALPVPQLGPDTAICTGSSLTLFPRATGLYTWNDGSSTDSLVASAAGWYFVRVVQAGCSGTDSLLLSLLALPTPDLGADLTVCNGDSAYIGLAGYASYAWSTGMNTDSIWVMQPGTYTVTVTDAAGCAGSDAWTLTWSPSPSVDLLGLLPDYCESDPVQALVGQPAGGTWGGAASGNGMFDPQSAGPGNWAVSYAFTDSLGCSGLAWDSTLVHAAPSPALAGPDLSNLVEIQLQATAPQIGVGHWELGSLSGSLSDLHDPHAILTTSESGSFPIVWVVENAPCAPTRDTLYLALDGLSMPSGFSPNGDGVNDYYVIRGIGMYPDAKLSIFNRWGNLVWQSNQYHNEWHGTNAQDQALADDTYYAILECGGKSYNTYIVLARVPQDQ